MNNNTPPIDVPLIIEQIASGLYQALIGSKGGIFWLVFDISAALAVLMVIVGGILYSTGNAEGGKKAITWALLGLVLALIAITIVKYVKKNIPINLI